MSTKTHKSVMFVFGMVIVTSIALLMPACEKDKNSDLSALDDMFGDSPYRSEDREREEDDDLALTPSSASVTEVGEKVAFTVDGGQKPYTWDVSDGGAGTILPTSTSTDIPQAIYTARKLVKNTVIVSDSLGRAATVDVTASADALSLSPTAWTITATNAAQFAAMAGTDINMTVSGGVSPYSWSSASGDMGTLASAAGAANVYTVVTTMLGDNIVTVRDSDGRSVTATITTEYTP